MRIVTVIPISRGISKDTLTYFTQEDVEVGSLVSIPVRNKKIHGLVIGAESATEAKAQIKTLSYNIKKISGVKPHSCISPSFVRAAGQIANYYASSIGSVLSALIPHSILENGDSISPPQPHSIHDDTFYETTLLQSNDEERYATYKSLIREEFARSKSVLFCVPTTEDLKNAEKSLEKGIEQYTFTLHSRLSKNEVLRIWNIVVSEAHPVLVIITGSFLSIPRHDIGTIVIEKESSRAYKMQTRPSIDIRHAAEYIARELNCRLLLGDILLRTETLWEHKNGTYSEISPLKFRSLTTAQCDLVGMRTPENQDKKEFSLLSDEALRILSTTGENNEHTFLFCGRKGLYPTTVCSDCGTVVTCKNCSAPVILYSKKQNGEVKNMFVCHQCGERRDAHELCIHCKGWRLTPLGVGIDRVAQKVASLLPQSHIAVMDKDHVTTHNMATKMRDGFYNQPGSILLGTEMALPYLNQKIENIIVVSLDSFFSIPDFRIHEKVFHILLSLRSIAERHMIIQTRQEKTNIFTHALRGNLVDFFRDEIDERKTFGYPPFTTYIKLTIEGDKSSVKKQMADISTYLEPYVLSVFDAFKPGPKQKYTAHGLVTLPKGTWVDEVLLSKLRGLPPSVSIKIDPDTLL